MSDLGIDRWIVEDRPSLIEAIGDTLDADLHQQPLTEAQRREVDRRREAHRANPSAVIPCERVGASAPARPRA